MLIRANDSFFSQLRQYCTFFVLTLVIIIFTDMMREVHCMICLHWRRHQEATTGALSSPGMSWMWNSCVMKRDIGPFTLMKMKKRCIKVLFIFFYDVFNSLSKILLNSRVIKVFFIFFRLGSH